MGITPDFYRYQKELTTNEDIDLIDLITTYTAKDAYVVPLADLPEDIRKDLMASDDCLDEEDSITIIVE